MTYYRDPGRGYRGMLYDADRCEATYYVPLIEVGKPAPLRERGIAYDEPMDEYLETITDSLRGPPTWYVFLVPPDDYDRHWALEGPRRELPLPSIFGYRGHWQLEGQGRS